MCNLLSTAMKLCGCLLPFKNANHEEVVPKGGVLSSGGWVELEVDTSEGIFILFMEAKFKVTLQKNLAQIMAKAED
jgi:hypothetical protein